MINRLNKERGSVATLRLTPDESAIPKPGNPSIGLHPCLKSTTNPLTRSTPSKSTLEKSGPGT